MASGQATGNHAAVTAACSAGRPDWNLVRDFRVSADPTVPNATGNPTPSEPGGATCVVTANQAGNEVYAPAPASGGHHK